MSATLTKDQIAAVRSKYEWGEGDVVVRSEPSGATEAAYLFHLPGKHNQKTHGNPGAAPGFAPGYENGPDMKVLGAFKPTTPANVPHPTKAQVGQALEDSGFDPTWVGGLTQKEMVATVHYFKGTGPYKNDNLPMDIKVKAFQAIDNSGSTTVGSNTGAGAVTAKGYDFQKKTHFDMYQEMNPQNTYSQKERSAMSIYQGGTYREMNRYLRGKNDMYGNPHSSSQIQTFNSTRDTLHGMMKKTTTQSDMVVFKGTRVPDKPGNLVGQVLNDKAMNSTSLKATVAKSFKPGEPPPAALLKVQVPKGTNAIYLDVIKGKEWERELLLPAGSSYLVTGVDSYGNVEVEYLPPAGFK